MSRKGNRSKEIASLDKLIEEITVDADGDDQQLWSFRQAFQDDVPLPLDAFVIGEPVSVVEIDYDGNERRALIAKVRRADGSEHVVATSDVFFPEGSSGERYVAAYRRWLGLEPYAEGGPIHSGRRRQYEATADDIDMSSPVELVVLSVKERVARCRPLGPVHAGLRA